MPLPILWGIAAAGVAALAWVKRKEIAEYFDSPAGQELMESIGKATQGAMEPYKKMLDEARPMDTDLRKEFFREAKNRMSDTAWGMLMATGKTVANDDSSYFSVFVDLKFISDE